MVLTLIGLEDAIDAGFRGEVGPFFSEDRYDLRGRHIRKACRHGGLQNLIPLRLGEFVDRLGPDGRGALISLRRGIGAIGPALKRTDRQAHLSACKLEPCALSMRTTPHGFAGLPRLQPD